MSARSAAKRLMQIKLWSATLRKSPTARTNHVGFD
jgi:hypothetical protein